MAPILLPTTAAAETSADTTHIVVPFAPGGPVEPHARVFAEALRAVTGHNYVIDNKPGAGGVLGALEVARARPDGSVLLYITAGHTSNAALYTKPPFDAIHDFTPISQIARGQGLALVVRAQSPLRTVQELVKAAQDRPLGVSYASLGNGQSSHIIAELFARAVKAQFLHVPYRTSPIPDILAGHVDCIWLGATSALPLVESGQARALAMSSEQRLAELPAVPTLVELGLADVDVPVWTGIVGPRGMSQDLANRIHKDMAQAAMHPDHVAWVKKGANLVVGSSPAQFAAYIDSEVQRYRRLLPPLGIRIDTGS